MSLSTDPTPILGKRIPGHDDTTMTRTAYKTAITLYGEGSEPGLVVRVDREEQNTVRQKRSFWLVLSAMIGIIGKFIYDGVAFFFNHPH